MRKNKIMVAVSLFATIGGDAFIVPAVPIAFGAIPASVYWVAVAAALVASGLARRVGRGRLLAMGAGLTALGLAICALSVGTLVLAIIGRAISGFGVGITMLAAQDAILSFTEPDRTARATTHYLSVYFAGMLTGSFFGGFLVGGPGFAAASGVGGLFCLAGAAAAWQVHSFADENIESSQLTWHWGETFPTFLILTAFPTRAVNGGMIYALPLLLSGQGRPPETIAAVAAIFPGVMLFCPVAGRWLEHRASGSSAIGQVLSAAALLLASTIVFAEHNQATAIAIVASVLLGIGQVIAMPAQTKVALAAAVRLPRPAALGIFRAIERIGLAAGPAVVGVLSGLYGLPHALRDLAFVSIASAALFSAFSLFRWQRP
jgi:MFS family permease